MMMMMKAEPCPPPMA